MLLLPFILSFVLLSSTDATTTSKSTATSTTSSTTSTTKTDTPLKAAAALKTPTLRKLYKGSNFFQLSDWNFFDTKVEADPTWGQVNYVPQAKALSNPGAPLISYQKNAAGGTNAIMRADNSATLPLGTKRNSIRIGSTATYNVGSLIIADMDHVPFGCSLWPAFWLVGPNWPIGGEIDVFEGINNGPFNQATLHTNNGCTRDLTGLETGTAGPNANCDTNSGYGCSVTDRNTQSYGAGFAGVGGGVFATSITADGISIWRWNRASIPADITKGAPKISGWGKPFATWKSTTCDISTHFRDMKIIFNIDICGSWAGNQDLWLLDDCHKTKGFASCASAVKDPRNFDNAYFSIRSLAVYNI